MTNNKEEPNSEYVSTPVDVEYGTTDSTEPEGNSKISCPSNPIRVSFPMNERPTPETDAAYKYWPSENAELVDADFARKLERERDEALEELNDIRINLGDDAEGYTLLHAVCALQNERDDLYYKLEDAKQSLEVALEELNQYKTPRN